MSSRLFVGFALFILSVSGQLLKTYSIIHPQDELFRICENSEDRYCLIPLEEDPASVIIRDDSNRAYILNLAEGGDIGKKISELLRGIVTEGEEITSPTPIPIESADSEVYGEDFPFTPQVRLRYETEGQEGSLKVKSLVLDDGNCECVFLRLGNDLCDQNPDSTVQDFSDLCAPTTRAPVDTTERSPGLEFFAHRFGTYNDWPTRSKIGYSALQAIQNSTIVAEPPIQDEDFYTPKVTSVGVDPLKEGLWIECYFSFQDKNEATPRIHKNFTNTYKGGNFSCERTVSNGSPDVSFKPDDAAILYEAGSQKVIAEIGIRFLSSEGLSLMEEVSLLVRQTTGATQDLTISPKTVDTGTEFAEFQQIAELLICNTFSPDGNCLTDFSESSPTFTIGDEIQVMMVAPTEINAELSTSPGILKIGFYLVDEETGKAEEQKGFSEVSVAKTERDGSPALLINLKFLEATSKIVIMEVETVLERLNSQIDAGERRFLESVQETSVVESTRISFIIKDSNDDDDTNVFIYALLVLSVVVMVVGGYGSKCLYEKRMSKRFPGAQRVPNDERQSDSEAKPEAEGGVSATK